MNKEKRDKSKGRNGPGSGEEKEYRIPIPSRERVLEVLESYGAPMPRKALMDELDLPSNKQQSAMDNRLRAMIRDGQILTDRRGRYCLTRKVSVVPGRVIGHKDGYGFLVPDEGDEDIYLSPRQMREIMHGDRVAVRIKGEDQRGRPEGSVVEILERNTSELVGRYVKESGVGFVIPDNPRFAQTVTIPARMGGNAKPGEIVVAEIVEHPTRGTAPVGRITEVLGAADAPGIETEVAIRAHGIPWEWPEEVLAAAEALGTRVRPADKEGREDLRELPLVTIDGADAKDFDDAVFCEPAGEGWRLIVAIADVSHYVTHRGALDEEARERGTSVYFPRRVVPMLPESLSNGLCSLNPKVDRLCLACEMHVDATGEVTVSRFFEGLMRSHARLTYDEVAAALEEPDEAPKGLAELMPRLQALHGVYRSLFAARERRGAIEFELPEVKFAFDRQGRIARVIPTTRNDAHKIIEECMIAANVAAAKYLKEHRLPTLYRVHAGPDEDRIEELATFLEAYGIKLPRHDKLKPKDYNVIVKKVRGRPDEALIGTVLLRSLAQAVYQPDNQGHFGLALPAYTHFTSPIRRYPDLLVHRGIRHILVGGGRRDARYDQATMERLGQHCSATERRADEATREALDWLKCEFMQDHVGDEFDAVITGVVAFGLFVQIPELQVEGLVHVSNLSSDYYRHDPALRQLVGDRTGKRWQLADTIRVRVAKVDMESRKIDFDPVGKGEQDQAGEGGGKARRGTTGGGRSRGSRKPGGGPQAGGRSGDGSGGSPKPGDESQAGGKSGGKSSRKGRRRRRSR